MVDHLQSIGATILHHNHNLHSNGNDNDNDSDNDNENKHHHHYNNDNKQGGEEGGKGREGNYIMASAPVRVWESLLATRFFVLRSHQPPPRPQPPPPRPLSKPWSLFLARQEKHSNTRSHPDTISATASTASATASASGSATATTTDSTTTTATTTTTAPVVKELVRCHSYSLPIELVDHVAFVFNTVQLPLTRNGVYSSASSSPSPSLSSSAAATTRTSVHQNTLDNNDDGGSSSGGSGVDDDGDGSIGSMGTPDLRSLSPNCLANNTMSLCRLQQGNTNPTMFIPVVMYFHHIPLLLLFSTTRYYRYPILKYPLSNLLPTTNNLIYLIQLNFLSHCWLSVLFYSLCFSVLWPTPAPPSPCQSTALPAKAVFSPP